MSIPGGIGEVHAAKTGGNPVLRDPAIEIAEQNAKDARAEATRFLENLQRRAIAGDPTAAAFLASTQAGKIGSIGADELAQLAQNNNKDSNNDDWLWLIYQMQQQQRLRDLEEERQRLAEAAEAIQNRVDELGGQSRELSLSDVEVGKIIEKDEQANKIERNADGTLSSMAAQKYLNDYESRTGKKCETDPEVIDALKAEHLFRRDKLANIQQEIQILSSQKKEMAYEIERIEQTAQRTRDSFEKAQDKYNSDPEGAKAILRNAIANNGNQEVLAGMKLQQLSDRDLNELFAGKLNESDGSPKSKTAEIFNRSAAQNSSVNVGKEIVASGTPQQGMSTGSSINL